MKTLAANCGFAEVESEVKSQIIQKTTQSKLRTDALRHPEYTLTDILTLGRTYEYTRLQTERIEKNLTIPSGSSTGTHSGSVNRLKKTHFQKEKSTGKSSVCYNCGGEWPHKGQCPAHGKICKKCGRKNHFARVCKSKQLAPPRISNKTYHGGDNKAKPNKVRNIEEQNDEYSSDSDGVYSMYHISGTHSSNKYTCEIMINGKMVQMEVDSGSDVSLISEEVFNQIKEGDVMLEMLSKKPVLSTYTGETCSIQPLGVVENIPVSLKGQEQKLSIVVTS